MSILNLLFILFFKDYSIFYDTRYSEVYRGLFNHRTVLGYFAVISICFSNIILFNFDFSKKSIIINIFIDIILIYYSHSGVATVVIILYPILFFALSRINLKYKKIILIYIVSNYILTNATIILKRFNSLFLQVLGRDFTLSGRLSLWENGIRLIKERIFLGYGFGVRLPVFNYDTYENSLAHLHNGVLDIVSNIGVVGFIPIIAILCISYEKAEKLYKNKSIFIKIFFVVILLVGFTEPYLFYKIGIPFSWVIILYIFII
ncbi:O-antigen ligase family protein [Clostridium sp.]|nr:O-antigen ligase family protein [Clostridium sp.]MDU3526248.1 O-antigen ligase family protein [Clostridium sp.]